MTNSEGLRGAVAQRAQQAQVATREQKAPLTIRELFDLQRSEIARALPRHMDPDRLIRIALTVIRTTPKLGNCTSESLLGALMLSAQLGLEPGPLGHCWFVPRRNKKLEDQNQPVNRRRQVFEVNWQLGYVGIVDLARRSGQLTDIRAEVVREKDYFEYQDGFDLRLTHRRELREDPGEMWCAWGVANLADGGRVPMLLSKQQIMQRKALSDSRNSEFSPWNRPESEPGMWRKSVIRAMRPWLPTSIEFAAAVAADDRTHHGTSPDLDYLSSGALDDTDVIDADDDETPALPAPVDTGGANADDDDYTDERTPDEIAEAAARAQGGVQ